MKTEYLQTNFVPRVQRHPLLMKMEGWYTTDPFSEEEAFHDFFWGFQPVPEIGWVDGSLRRARHLVMMAAESFVREQKEKKNLPKFTRYLTRFLREQNSVPVEPNVQNYVYHLKRNSNPEFRFKLSCRYNDFVRMGESNHFDSCVAEGNSMRDTKYNWFRFSDACIVYVPDASGKMLARTVVLLMKDGNGKLYLLFVRHYGNTNWMAIAKKIESFGIPVVFNARFNRIEKHLLPQNSVLETISPVFVSKTESRSFYSGNRYSPYLDSGLAWKTRQPPNIPGDTLMYRIPGDTLMYRN